MRVPVSLAQQDRQAHLSRVNSAVCTQKCENIEMGRGKGEKQKKVAYRPVLSRTVSVTIDYLLSFNLGEGNACGQES